MSVCKQQFCGISTLQNDILPQLELDVTVTSRHASTTNASVSARRDRHNPATVLHAIKARCCLILRKNLNTAITLQGGRLLVPFAGDKVLSHCYLVEPGGMQ